MTKVCWNVRIINTQKITFYNILVTVWDNGDKF